METSGARVLVAADGAGPESKGAAEDIGPELEEVAAEDVVDPLLSVDADPLLAAEDIWQDSQEPNEVIMLLAVDGVVPDSQEVTADGMVLDEGMVLVAVDAVVPNSVEMVSETLPPGTFICGSCHLVHEDREPWNRAHSRFYPCPSCGLVHSNYAISAMLDRIKVDYERSMEHYKGLLPTMEDAKASQE